MAEFFAFFPWWVWLLSGALVLVFGITFFVGARRVQSALVKRDIQLP